MKPTLPSCLLIAVLTFALSLSALSQELSKQILMFVSHDHTYYTEYIVMRRSLEAAGYTIDLRSSVTSPANIYGGSVNSNADQIAAGYSGFTQQFQSIFGSAWSSSWNNQPSTVTVNGRIQDIPNMDNYDALVIVGGTGAVYYRLDGDYSAHGSASVNDVRTAAEQLNALAIDALRKGKVVMGQCHGASIPAFFRIPGTSGSGAEALGYSILKDGFATGFPESVTAPTLSSLDITHRPNDRVTISSPHSALDDNGLGDYKIITTRDWYPQTITHAARSLLNVIETFPSLASVSSQNISVLIIHGGTVDPTNCSPSNSSNDVPCNHGTASQDLPADYTDIQQLLQANSPNDSYQFTVSNVDITSSPLPYGSTLASIQTYLSQFDAVIFFKHWSQNLTTDLQNAIVSYADHGGTVIALHHAMYNNGNGKDILVDQLFGAEASSQTWTGAPLADMNLYMTNLGHYVTTYGVMNSLPDPLTAPATWDSTPLLPSSNTSFSYYQQVPIYDEIYNNFAFVPEMSFGRNVNQITPLLSNGSTPSSQNHTAGFVRLFDNDGDGIVGKVVCMAPGERQTTININHLYGQFIRNSVAWSRLGVEPQTQVLLPPTLTTSSSTSTTATLTWQSPATVLHPPLTYNILQNGVVIQTGITNTSMTVNGLQPNTSYSYTVIAVDATGNISQPSQPLTVTTLPPTNVDPLELLSDDFGSSSSLQDWSRLYVTENWNEDPLTSYQLSSGQMIMVPSHRTWYQDRIGAFSFQEISGDFVITTSVHVTGNNGEGVPDQAYSMAGILVRVPQPNGYNAQTDFSLGQQTYHNFEVGFTNNTGPQILYNRTTNGVSSFTTSAITSYDVTIRLARVGNVMIALYRQPAGQWVVYDAYDWSGLPTTLQVGLSTIGNFTVARTFDPFLHNNTALIGPSHIQAAFDYVHFRMPSVPPSLINTNLTVATDAQLLSFLGFEEDEDSSPTASDHINPLSGLSDEFENPASLSSWLRLYETENWTEDPLNILDINSLQAGTMTIVPSSRTWWQNKIGDLTYKNVTGDFIVTTDVSVSGINSVFPSPSYSLAGLMVRMPQASGYNAPVHFTTGQQNYYNVMVGVTTNGPRLLYNRTQNSVSANPTVQLSSYHIQIRLARMGNVLASLYREPDGEWQLNEIFQWNNLPATLQVGMSSVADFTTANNLSNTDHNNRNVTGNANIIALYEYVRFDVPQIPTELVGQNLTTLGDQTLLSFLGFSEDHIQTGARYDLPSRESRLRIYPNPATEYVEIVSDSTIDNVFVINALGVEVMDVNNIQSNSTTIDLRNVTPGLYILKIDGSSYRMVKH